MNMCIKLKSCLFYLLTLPTGFKRMEAKPVVPLKGLCGNLTQSKYHSRAQSTVAVGRSNTNKPTRGQVTCDRDNASALG